MYPTSESPLSLSLSLGERGPFDRMNGDVQGGMYPTDRCFVGWDVSHQHTNGPG